MIATTIDGIVPAASLTPLGGEFADRAIEAEFVAARFGETRRHATILLVASALLNGLFLASDWRFEGTSHFWVAVGARLAVVLGSLVCLAAARRARSAPRLQAVLFVWMLLAALGVAVLVTSRSSIALFVVAMLPTALYLTVPVGFRALLCGGVGASILLYLGYGEYRQAGHTGLGLALALLILNVALMLRASRTNRLERIAWSAARALDRSRDALARIFAASPIPLVVTRREDGTIEQMNEAAIGLIGPVALNRETMRDRWADPTIVDEMLARLDRDGRLHDFEAVVRCADGAPRTVSLRVVEVELDGTRRRVSSLVDISAHKAAQHSLEWLASTDPLTGLPNRLSFFESGRAALARATATGQKLAMLMIDLDHFKQINDRHGHAGGDQALRGFGELCMTMLPDEAVAGRLGGEEFGVLLPGFDRAAAARLAERVRETLAAVPMLGEDGAIGVTASIGVAELRADERELHGALARADAALYLAKRGGRNRVVCDEDAARRGASA